MGSREAPETEVHLKAEKIGGIEQTKVAFSPGVTVLTGRNATNRTSLLQAVMTALGSNSVSLKGNVEKGSVSLQVGGEEYIRTITRKNGTMQFSGNPYLDDSELADLFAFLLESNKARRTVALEQDLREIIMQPVDADAIKAEIRQLKSERDDIDDQTERRKQLKQKLPQLEQHRSSLEDEIEDKQAELDDLSTDADEARSEQSELDEKMQTLQEKRSALDTAEFRLDSEQESLESLVSEREELETEYDELMDQETGDINQIKSEISRLRESKQRLESELNKLQSVIQFNEEMLEGTSTDIAAALRGEDDN